MNKIKNLLGPPPSYKVTDIQTYRVTTRGPGGTKNDTNKGWIHTGLNMLPIVCNGLRTMKIVHVQEIVITDF